MCSTITTKDIDSMFSNMEKLIPLNEGLLHSLLDHCRSPYKMLQSSVGQIFADFVSAISLFLVMFSGGMATYFVYLVLVHLGPPAEVLFDVCN